MKEPGYDAYIGWSKKYGPMYTFWLGETPVICLTDYNLINETFVKDGDAYVGRIKAPMFMKLIRSPYGVVWTEGSLWKEQRRFALQVLRNFGLGKNIMQERILVEVSSLIEQINNDINAGVLVHDILTPIGIGVGSLINNLVFGYRFEGKKLQEYHELKPLLGQFVRGFGSPWTLLIQKWYQYAKYIPFCRYYYYLMKDATDTLHEFYMRQINAHIEKFDPHDESEPTDYVEAFLKEKAKREAEGDTNNYFIIPQLLGMCYDFWLAGQETTTNTLAWGVLYLMIEPEVQARLQKEFDMVIGSDRLITVEDKHNLHYASAVVNLSIVPEKPPSLYRKAGASVSPHPYVCHIEKRYCNFRDIIS
uniref:Cytochrome P450 n=1 Tax=Acrobeloides nanus TaxID=290746 RepID=A0A914CT29_9BILA